MPYTLGSQKSEVFRWGPEAHKLHLEMLVSGTINIGEPVKLLPTADMTAVALEAADAENLCVGVSLHPGKNAYGDYTVIATRGYVVVMMQISADDSVPGPVQYAGWDATSGFGEVVALSTGGHIGWLLAGGDDGVIAPVLIKD